jgi:hypothetical protein
MNGKETFRDKIDVHDSAPFCTMPTTRLGQVSCLVNLDFFETFRVALRDR